MDRCTYQGIVIDDEYHGRLGCHAQPHCKWLRSAGMAVINTFRELRPLLFPVTEQVVSLPALEQCSAWIGSRRTRYNGVRHRQTHLTSASVAIIKAEQSETEGASCCGGAVLLRRGHLSECAI